ncbi:GNAT family N-acetyltransferase [Halalkalibacter alkaliphilus]|uniref:GNAT family N-acetyltransferase n=1 Tax=Halalkalibacter alkaliphilus TaxID=2917993 RepID=A0A9X2CWC3_9BACI|nr:GNAT family protein [Halalkalibacter alkaliphilus]MCL7749448.1 GNAT family N-acetyltransferase [Halalkalibacter alkaliphilus]
MKTEQIYSNLPILTTDRLILRKISLNDLEAMFDYGSNEEVTKYVTWNTHQTLTDTREFIDFVLQNYENQQVAPWGIELKDEQKFIGTIDFVWWKPTHKTAEIGYVISQDYWGKGITTEAATKVVEFGFEQMDLVRIQARCFVENLRSQRVMEKIGMSFEGINRKDMLVKGKHRDLKIFSILKEEFKR